MSAPEIRIQQEVSVLIMLIIGPELGVIYNFVKFLGLFWCTEPQNFTTNQKYLEEKEMLLCVTVTFQSDQIYVRGITLM